MRTLRATRLRKKRSCSETGSTRGPNVVMLAFSACPAMDIRSFDRYTPAQILITVLDQKSFSPTSCYQPQQLLSAC